MRLHPHSLTPSWRLVAATAATALVASLSLVASQPAVVDVDGQRIVSDVSPVTAGGVAYLPIRAVAEAAGATTAFDAASQVLTVRRGTSSLRMTIGTRNATFDGQRVTLAHAPFVVHGRAMVRGADVSTILASAVHYDERRGRIDVRTPGAVVAGVNDDP